MLTGKVRPGPKGRRICTVRASRARTPGGQINPLEAPRSTDEDLDQLLELVNGENLQATALHKSQTDNAGKLVVLLTRILAAHGYAT